MKFYIFLIFTISIISMTYSQSESAAKHELFYVYDPLCGWCYGFSPVMHKVQEKYQDILNVEVISGGMILGDRVGPLAEHGSYIRSGVKRVEDMTGVSFGQSFLDDLFGQGTRIMDSWPSCVALTVFKSFLPENSLDFASKIQHAIYWDGKDCQDYNVFAQLAVPYGITAESFLDRCQDDSYHLLTKQEFQFANDLKAQGYPYVVLRKGDEYFLVAHGYTNFETISKRLDEMVR
jgi:putative protein-disulfide isomerase